MCEDVKQASNKKLHYYIYKWSFVCTCLHTEVIKLFFFTLRFCYRILKNVQGPKKVQPHCFHFKLLHLSLEMLPWFDQTILENWPQKKFGREISEFLTMWNKILTFFKKCLIIYSTSKLCQSGQGKHSVFHTESYSVQRKKTHIHITYLKVTQENSKIIALFT